MQQTIFIKLNEIDGMLWNRRRTYQEDLEKRTAKNYGVGKDGKYLSSKQQKRR